MTPCRLDLADPGLEVGYAIGDGRWATVSGTEVSLPADGGARTVTPLVRDGESVAVIVHRGGVRDDADLVAEVTSSARLLLDNERLQADVRAREADLRASRARIVESGDAERRRLERDLHDGAQQRLVGLMLGLRLARAGVDAGDEELRARLGETERELELAVTSLRDVATGIHPASLSTFGLSEALGALAERSGNPVQINAVPPERLPAAVETAAYHIVAEAAANGAVVVALASTGGRLHLDVEATNGAEHVDRVRGPRRRPRRLAARRLNGAGRGRAQGGDPVRVVIAEDSMLVREGVARLLADAGIDVVGTASTADELLDRVDQLDPDVAIVDIRMPPTQTDEGIVAAQQIRRTHPRVGVLLLSQYLDSAYAARLLEDVPQGAGYLLKDRVSDIAVLADAIRRVAEGECVVDPTIVSRLVHRPRLHGPLDELSDREREVLGLMAEGRSNLAIGQSLFVSDKTVESHVRLIFQKLGLEQSPDDHRRVLAVLAFLRG